MSHVTIGEGRSTLPYFFLCKKICFCNFFFEGYFFKIYILIYDNDLVTLHRSLGSLRSPHLTRLSSGLASRPPSKRSLGGQAPRSYRSLRYATFTTRSRELVGLYLWVIS